MHQSFFSVVGFGHLSQSRMLTALFDEKENNVRDEASFSAASRQSSISSSSSSPWSAVSANKCATLVNKSLAATVRSAVSCAAPT